MPFQRLLQLVGGMAKLTSLDLDVQTGYLSALDKPEQYYALLCQLSQLSSLCLDVGDFKRHFPWIEQLAGHSLTHLGLMQERFTASDLQLLAGSAACCRALRQLDVADLMWWKSDPFQDGLGIAKLTQLTQLHTFFTHRISDPAVLAQFPHLTSLELAAYPCANWAALAEALSHCRQLHSLAWLESWKHRPTPAQMKAVLAGLPALTSLQLWGDMTSADFSCLLLPHLQRQLRRFSLYCCAGLSAADPLVLLHFLALETLTIKYCFNLSAELLGRLEVQEPRRPGIALSQPCVAVAASLSFVVNGFAARPAEPSSAVKHHLACYFLCRPTLEF